MPDPALVEVVGGLPTIAVAAATYRHLTPGRAPLGGEGARIQGGRWNPPESFPTLYLAFTVDGAVAEFRRLAVKAGRQTSDFLPRELYRVDVELTTVLDLTDPDSLGVLGVTAAQLTGEDLSLPRGIGDAAHYLDIEAVQAPSAAAAGARVLAVFTDKLTPAARLRPVLIDTWNTDPPAGV